MTFVNILNWLPDDFDIVLTQYILTHLLTSIVVGWTSPSSPARPVALASIIKLSVSLQSIVTTWADQRPLATIILLFTWLTAATALDLFFITKATYGEHTQWLQERKMGFEPTFLHRLNWALQMPMNYRRINTKWQISQIPPFDSDVPDYVPTKTVFLLHRLLTTILGFGAFFYFWVNPVTMPHSSGDNPYVLLDGCDFSLNALLSRFYIVAFFIGAIFTGHTAEYAAASVIFVSLNLSDPDDWPPFQRPVTGTWTVRRLWGHTWHQSLRAFLQHNTDVVVFTLLRLPPRKVYTRYTRFFLCFIQSGILHSAFDAGWGVTSLQNGAFLLFSIQPLGFAVEEFVTWVCNRYGLFVRDGPLRTLVGYTWVVLWCTATWPIWIYPELKNMVERGADVPFLHLKYVG
ncbi:hypothetical protein BDV06DRAFT_223779 [Aspergillus oleicola]